jgi:large subunit ribosomal protein L9
MRNKNNDSCDQKGCAMKVYLKKDVERIGMAGEIIKVKEGFAINYLIPHGLGIAVTDENANFFKKRERTIENRKEVLSTQTSMLAEKINALDLILKKKMHDDGKLYGALSSSDIVEKLAEKGVSVSKNQIIFGKSIKSKGVYEVTIKLSSRLQPKIKVTIVPE